MGYFLSLILARCASVSIQGVVRTDELNRATAVWLEQLRNSLGFSQRQVGQARTLAREAPGRLTVSGQGNNVQLCTHALATPAIVSGIGLLSTRCPCRTS